MFKKIVKSYTKLIDTKIENGTFVVMLIAALIVSASLIINDTNTFYYSKSNILEVQQDITSKNSIIEINGIKYRIILEELSKK
ncbi:MAG: hypothetical protein QM490_00960 [Candidatus Gracilibacteria bacterium]